MGRLIIPHGVHFSGVGFIRLLEYVLQPHLDGKIAVIRRIPFQFIDVRLRNEKRFFILIS